MKRYLLFCMDQYYPSGGWNDFVGDYDTIPEAFTATQEHQSREYFHIVDTESASIVEFGEIEVEDQGD